MTTTTDFDIADDLLTQAGKPRKLRDDDEFHSAFSTLGAMQTEIDERRADVAAEVQRMQNELAEEVADWEKAVAIREEQLKVYAGHHRERLFDGKQSLRTDAGTIEFRKGRETLQVTVKEETAIARMEACEEGLACLKVKTTIDKRAAMRLEPPLLRKFGLKVETGAESCAIKLASNSQKKG